MKTRNLLICIALTFLAKTGIAATSANEPLNKVIRKTVNYPSFAKDERLQGIVLVDYVVHEDGSIEVKMINASHQSLANYVERKLESLKIIPRQAEGRHFAKFHFKYVDLTN